MTLEKLAKAAFVSVSTVSKAFSESPEISEKTKQHIFDIARQYGCFEKYYKPKYGKYTVAVICPEVKSAYYSAILTKLEEGISKKGASMMLSLSNFSSKTVSEHILYYAHFAHADAIIVIGEVPPLEYECEIPIIALSSSGSNDANVEYVHTNFEGAVCDAVGLLKKYGHRKIGFIGEPLTCGKLSYFCSAMQKNSLEINESFIKTVNARFEDAGYLGMESILQSADRPTALIAAYDEIALGAILKIREIGCDVPQDFSIIGMDDITVVSYMNVPLTSIRLNVDALCSTCVEITFRKLKNKYYSPKIKPKISSKLIVRESVRDISKRG